MIYSALYPIIITLYFIFFPLDSFAVYKWEDEKGNVFFGDNPPEAAKKLESVTIQPGPTEEQVKHADEIQQRRIDDIEKYKEVREAREAEEARRRATENQITQEKQEVQDKDNNSVPIRARPCRNPKHPNYPCKPGYPGNKPRPEHPIVKPRPPVVSPAK